MKNLFGTDGIRDRAGTGLFEPRSLMILGKALMHWIQHTYGPHTQILIAHDTRISSYCTVAALKAGLLQGPVVLHHAALLPTPALMHLMRADPQLQLALMISASHNPFYDNGIKIIDAKTGKISVEDELALSQLFHTMNTSSLIPQECAEFGIELPFIDSEKIYREKIGALFPPQFLSGKTIVLDTAHGATYQVAPRIFTEFGAHVITLNANPTGYNINEQCGALHTEQLAAAVLQHRAYAGFAFDGDGDRVIAVAAHGEIKDGDDLLALLSTHPRYAHSPTIVGTIMSNEGLVQFLAQQNKRCVRTPVGDKYIAQQLQAQQLLLGGEPSGHIIAHDIVPTGDGILVALLALETMLMTHNHQLNTFTKYPQVMINVPVTHRKDLNTEPFSSIIATAQQKISNGNGGRISVRYSGTENVLRVMIEADTQETAQHTCQQLADTLAHALTQPTPVLYMSNKTQSPLASVVDGRAAVK